MGGAIAMLELFYKFGFDFARDIFSSYEAQVHRVGIAEG